MKLLIICYALITLPLLAKLIVSFSYKSIKKRQKASKIMPKSGCFRQASDCRHPKEYTCIKCGDCGRKFIK